MIFNCKNPTQHDKTTANATSSIRRKTVLSLIICMLLLTQGCIIFLSTVGTIISMRSSKYHTVTVQIDRTPEEIYNAMIRIVARSADVASQSYSDRYLVEAARGQNRVIGEAIALSDDLSQLIITVDAKDPDSTDEDLALNVVKQICAELDVGCKMPPQ